MAARPDYGSPEYWDARYISEGNRTSHDCYFNYAAIQKGLEPFFKPAKAERILIVGCGTSTMGEDMLAAGFRDVTCMDFSSAAIRILTQRQVVKQPSIKYLVMDVRDMSAFSDGSFDAVIDKGVLDSVVCGVANSAAASSMMDEVFRILSPDGACFVFSNGTYASRAPYIDSNPAWQINQISIGQPIHFLALYLRKKAALS
ncbi:methyltransferase-like protein 13-like isoform X1 [Achlya hypogyna]|uniref:Methyltransferase-like protein 13-like isoform X1 n=1 Tax=Achlya hypogyna TaxID=1202772 RepID=A0A1V9Z051_ACHHY|nr:methyltransferase-like protein 13-like isoform X1 [Achlya hypogyna]